MKTANKKSAALTMRNALLRAGATEEQIAVAMGVINPQAHKAIKVTRQVVARIVELLDKPGAKCVLIRAKGGIRVMANGSLEKMRASAQKHKPWLKSATHKAHAAAVPSAVPATADGGGQK